MYKIRLYENINGVVVVFELLREIERVKQRARVIQFIFLLFCIEKCVNIARSFVFNDKGVFFHSGPYPTGLPKVQSAARQVYRWLRWQLANTRPVIIGIRQFDSVKVLVFGFGRAFGGMKHVE